MENILGPFIMIIIMVKIELISIIVESIVALIISIMLYFMVKKYREKKSEISKLLINVFLYFVFSVIFSIIAKIFWYHSESSEGISLVNRSYFVGIVMEFRFVYIFVAISLYFCLKFRETVFNKEVSEKKLKKYKIITLLMIIYDIAVFDPTKSYLDLIASGMIFMYMAVIYLPLMNQAFKLRKKIDEVEYSHALKSIGLMALSLFSIFFFLLLDRVMIVLGSNSYTIFYFISQIFALVAGYYAYFGYVRPRNVKSAKN